MKKLAAAHAVSVHFLVTITSYSYYSYFEPDPGHLLYGVVFLIISILMLVKPRFMLMFGRKWKYKNAEPSDFAIEVSKITGILGILVGIALIGSGFGLL